MIFSDFLYVYGIYIKSNIFIHSFIHSLSDKVIELLHTVF